MEPLTITIEIPQGCRDKYEADHDTGKIFLSRVLFTSMGYPTNYGYIEHTLGEDGDPLDALLLCPSSIYPGTVVHARAVAAFVMSDENGPDAKILMVPAGDPRWEHITDLADVPQPQLDEISHFFEHYKDLEPEKYSTIEGWQDRASAQRLILDAQERF